MTGNMISVETSGASGQMGAYMATPDGEGAPGLVIIQEVFGVNDFIRATVEAYAAKGFVTAAPDIFWRLEPGVQLNPNKEEEFNRWYSDVHLPEVLQIDGFQTAQRFRLTEQQMQPQSHGYLAIYNINSEDVSGTLENLRNMRSLTMSDALDLSTLQINIFTEL